MRKAVHTLFTLDCHCESALLELTRSCANLNLKAFIGFGKYIVDEWHLRTLDGNNGGGREDHHSRDRLIVHISCRMQSVSCQVIMKVKFNDSFVPVAVRGAVL